MKLLLLSVLLIGAAATFLQTVNATDDIERFDNFKTYNVFLESADQMKEFVKLNKKHSIHLLRQGTEHGMPFYLAVEPTQQINFEKDLLQLNISFSLLNSNLQDALDQRYMPNARTFSKTTMDWTKYHDLPTINSWITKIARENSFIKKRIIGFSSELRPIYALVVSKKPNNKAIFIESNIHAIEWISSAVTTYFFNHLISTNSHLLEEYDWIYIPILNPDGFHYTHTKNPLWRKNRRWTGYRNSSGLCYGIDLNRNFDSYWGTSGYNLNDPCDHFYAGKRAQSEPEVRAVVRFIKSFKKDYVRMHLAFHSYGQLVLYPYGHTDEIVPDNIEDLAGISAAFAGAAEARHGVEYLHGASGKLLGYVSGAAKDYWYDQGIKYTATIELPDRGQYGFFLPARFIQPTCEEVTDGLYAMIDEAQKRKLFD